MGMGTGMHVVHGQLREKWLILITSWSIGAGRLKVSHYQGAT